MTKTLPAKIGPRDIDLLTAIDRYPITSAQLCRLSQTFESPFRDENNLRRRLRALTQAGLLQSWPYAVAGDGRSPRYFKLTREGYRLLYGTNATLPKRRYFEAIRPGHHHHTFSLAELMTHLIVSAKRHGCSIEHFARENSVCLQVHSTEATTSSDRSRGGALANSIEGIMAADSSPISLFLGDSANSQEPSVFTVFPDAAFVIRRADGSQFPFCLELDNGTERVRSKQDVESIERKLRAYDAHQSQFTKFDPNRYLVLIVTTRCMFRVQHILQLASSVMRHPGRTVFVGASLSSCLELDPFTDALLIDHRGLKRTLVPRIAS